MRMLLVALGLLLATVAAADEPPAVPPASPPSTAAPPSPPAEQTTTVKGAVPDLMGRWLAVGVLKLPNESERTVTALWDVAGANAQQQMTIRFLALPAAQQKKVDKANVDQKGWKPAPEDVAAIASAWATLAVQDPKVATVTTELIAHDEFDAAMKSEAISKDALFVIRQAEIFLPTAAPTLRQVNIYAPLAETPTGYTGNFTLAVVAAAPFPIPIALNGTAELIRLDARPSGFVARLLDVFRGCGR